jgi:hypothetical protein
MVLDSLVLEIIPYASSHILVLTESTLYVLSQEAITSQVTMCHGVPSCAAVNIMNGKVILVGTHDSKVLVYSPSL